MHYCPGCTHGIVHRLVAQAIEELGIEGKTVGVALLQDDRLLYECYLDAGMTHSETLMPLIDNCLKLCGMGCKDIDLYGVNAGPGSFTGLRIGLAAVKGLAFPRETLCAPVSTLEALAAAHTGCGTVLCALDARRAQVYSAAFDLETHERLMEDDARAVADLAEFVENCKKPLFFVGDGAALCYNKYDNVPGVLCVLPALRNGRAAAVAYVAKQMAQRGEAVLPEALLPDYHRLSQAERERAERLAAEAAAFGEHPADRLARVLTVLDDAALEMRGASDVRLVLEIACTRLARPEADLTIEALAERVARLEAMVANGAVPASVAAAQAAAPVASVPAAAQQPTLISGARAAAPAASAAPAATSARQGGMPWDRGAAAPAAQPAPVSASKPAAPAPQPAPAPTPQPQSNNAAQVAAAGAAETPAVEDAGELQRKWAEVVERVKARQASYAGLLLNARATADDGSKLTVSFPAGSTFAIKMLGRADTQSVVLPTVCAVFGRRTVDYVLDGGGTPAPQHEEHSPSARAAASADPQPVSSAAPVSSSASAPQQQAAPVTASTSSAPKPAAPKPAAPTPAPKPVSPAPKSSDLGKAPWLRSDNPAGAPATGKLPTEPAPRAPERSAAPKAQPVAQSAPWESEQVPYDDAMVGGFAGDASGDDLPPFDVPGATPAPKSAVAAPKEEDAPAAPWESNPGAGSPFGHQGAAPSIPQTEDEAKDLIRSVFGQATIFKPVE